MAAISPERHGEAFSAFLERNLQKDLLRFTTAGSVDDGKSTLIGHLLHDVKGVYEDQLASVRQSRINRSGGPLDFSLITDGLRAEREQGITIDVGYRYFETSRRKFIIADTPGHEQYTRNMATGASTSDLAVILLDATKGLLPQTFRHAYIASLLGIRYVLAAINKMDLADYREDVYLRLEEEILALAAELQIPEIVCIPVSALAGDNVVRRSERMPWYTGPTMLEHLESVPVPLHAAAAALRLPVQLVLRPDAAFRGFAGRVAAGRIRPGDKVMALPSGRASRVKRLVAYDGDLEEAAAPQSVTVELEDEIDVSRGDMLVAPDEPPVISKHFSAMLVWLHPQHMEPGREYLLKHATRQVRARAVRILHRVNVRALAKEQARELEMNDIALVELSTTLPLYFDPYKQNRVTGSFILIDPLTNATVGAGMIQAGISSRFSAQPSRSTATGGGAQRSVSATERHARRGHVPLLVIHHGDAGFAQRLERALFDAGFDALRLPEQTPSGESVWTTVRTLLAAGLVVLSFAESLRDAPLEEFRNSGQAPVHELSAGQNLEEQFKEVLALAERLRIESSEFSSANGNL